jgi:hypothetical protein
MLYVRIQNAVAVSATKDIPADYDDKTVLIQTRNDWKTLARAEELAAQLTASTGATYLATDAGPNCSPRYDVIEVPMIGAEVSRYFNGDGYPAGTIVKISRTFKRIETSEGVVFFRRGKTGSWVNDGTWSMVAGRVNDRNPSL